MLGIDAPRAEEVLGRPGFETANILEEHAIHVAETCVVEPFESLPVAVQNAKELSRRWQNQPMWLHGCTESAWN